jgi:hypothetical protein
MAGHYVDWSYGKPRILPSGIGKDYKKRGFGLTFKTHLGKLPRLSEAPMMNIGAKV